jgi:hypothetical protein
MGLAIRVSSLWLEDITPWSLEALGCSHPTKTLSKLPETIISSDASLS